LARGQCAGNGEGGFGAPEHEGSGAGRTKADQFQVTEDCGMFLRIDKLQIELPKPKEADPNAAAAVQELLGGRFGEMSTLMNYMYQSFNFRGREKLRPYYELIANIATEELGHIELVSASVNMLLNGPRTSETQPVDPVAAPLESARDVRNTHHFIATAQTTLVGNSMGQPWRGDYVFASGNLILDLLHNFFLECGARTQKLRVYDLNPWSAPEDFHLTP
jgi:Mn-containing catalase